MKTSPYLNCRFNYSFRNMDTGLKHGKLWSMILILIFIKREYIISLDYSVFGEEMYLEFIDSDSISPWIFEQFYIMLLWEFCLCHLFYWLFYSCRHNSQSNLCCYTNNSTAFIDTGRFWNLLFPDAA